LHACQLAGTNKSQNDASAKRKRLEEIRRTRQWNEP